MWVHNPIKHTVCKENHVLIPSAYTCECDKETDESFRNFNFMKIFIHDSVINVWWRKQQVFIDSHIVFIVDNYFY